MKAYVAYVQQIHFPAIVKPYKKTLHEYFKLNVESLMLHLKKIISLKKKVCAAVNIVSCDFPCRLCNMVGYNI